MPGLPGLQAPTTRTLKKFKYSGIFENSFSPLKTEMLTGKERSNTYCDSRLRSPWRSFQWRSLPCWCTGPPCSRPRPSHRRPCTRRCWSGQSRTRWTLQRKGVRRCWHYKICLELSNLHFPSLSAPASATSAVLLSLVAWTRGAACSFSTGVAATAAASSTTSFI